MFSHYWWLCQWVSGSLSAALLLCLYTFAAPLQTVTPHLTQGNMGIVKGCFPYIHLGFSIFDFKWDEHIFSLTWFVDSTQLISFIRHHSDLSSAQILLLIWGVHHQCGPAEGANQDYRHDQSQIQEQLHLLHSLVKDTKGRANWILVNVQSMLLF